MKYEATKNVKTILMVVGAVLILGSVLAFFDHMKYTKSLGAVLFVFGGALLGVGATLKIKKQ